MSTALSRSSDASLGSRVSPTFIVMLDSGQRTQISWEDGVQFVLALEGRAELRDPEGVRLLNYAEAESIPKSVPSNH